MEDVVSDCIRYFCRSVFFHVRGFGVDNIGRYTVEEFIAKLTEFHGNFAPGLLIGGYMVDLAVKNMTQYEFYDAICESPSCLPDAIQMLTPCTVGNGWLKIIDTGRYAIALYEKRSGRGVRVFLDVAKLDPYPEITTWFMRLKPKSEQDSDRLRAEIISAGCGICTMQEIVVSPRHRGKHAVSPIAVCASCGEAYPHMDGRVCLACQGAGIYQQDQ